MQTALVEACQRPEGVRPTCASCTMHVMPVSPSDKRHIHGCLFGGDWGGACLLRVPGAVRVFRCPSARRCLQTAGVALLFLVMGHLDELLLVVVLICSRAVMMTASRRFESESLYA